jgi:hypothetical protein
MNKALIIRIDYWTLEIFNFEFLLVLNHVDGDLGLPKDESSGGKGAHFETQFWNEDRYNYL